MREVQQETRVDSKSNREAQAIDVLELLKDSEAPPGFMKGDHLPAVTIDGHKHPAGKQNDWKTDLNQFSRVKGEVKIGSEKLEICDGKVLKNGKQIGQTKDGGVIKFSDGRSIDLKNDKSDAAILLTFSLPAGEKHEVLSAKGEHYDLGRGRKNVARSVDEVDKRYKKYVNDGGWFEWDVLEPARHLIFPKTVDDAYKEVTDIIRQANTTFQGKKDAVEKTDLSEADHVVKQIRDLRNFENLARIANGAHNDLTEVCADKHERVVTVAGQCMGVAIACLTYGLGGAAGVAEASTAEAAQLTTCTEMFKGVGQYLVKEFGPPTLAGIVAGAGSGTVMGAHANWKPEDYAKSFAQKAATESALAVFPVARIFKGTGIGPAAAKFGKQFADDLLYWMKEGAKMVTGAMVPNSGSGTTASTQA